MAIAITHLFFSKWFLCILYNYTFIKLKSDFYKIFGKKKNSMINRIFLTLISIHGQEDIKIKKHWLIAWGCKRETEVRERLKEDRRIKRIRKKDEIIGWLQLKSVMVTLFKAITNGVLRCFNRFMDSIVWGSSPCIISTTRTAISQSDDPRERRLLWTIKEKKNMTNLQTLQWKLFIKFQWLYFCSKHQWFYIEMNTNDCTLQ